MTGVSRLNFDLTDLLINHIHPLPLNENGIKGIEEFLNVKSDNNIFELDEKSLVDLNEEFNQNNDFNLFELININVFSTNINIIFVDKDLNNYDGGYDQTLITIKTL